MIQIPTHVFLQRILGENFPIVFVFNHISSEAFLSNKQFQGKENQNTGYWMPQDNRW